MDATTLIDPLHSCRLLALPIELRERIYRFALVADRAIVWPSASSPNELSPSLLATCRQVHQEAAPILYKSNRFTFCHPSDCNVFRHIMDHKNVLNISLVAFKIRENDLRLWTEYLGSTAPERSLSADLPNLQSLAVFLRQNGRAREIDEEHGFSDWHRHRGLRHLCMSLEGRTPADIRVVFSARVRDDTALETIRKAHPELFISGDAGFARSKPLELRASTHVELELISMERQQGTNR